MRLWHYTCSCSIRSIIASAGTLRPNPNPGAQPRATALAASLGHTGPIVALPVIWLTDLYVRTAEDVFSIGLDGLYSRCNRVEYRFRVPGSPAISPWSTWADTHLDADHAEYRALLELGRQPHHWWVADVPLPGARLDESYSPPA